MKKTLKFIGGESALASEEYDLCFTDSGRSSLKLILKSLPKKLKYLLPDFLCSSVIDVFDKLGLKYSFYKIKSDFSIDAESVSNSKFDVFYNINYFGRINKPQSFIGTDKILIDDNVFLPDFERNEAFEKWAGFNSFRKISPAADGSILKASFKIEKQFSSSSSAPFADLKYQGKAIKYEFLAKGKYSEKKYLSLFNEAETMLDNQTQIYGISDRSMAELLKFFKNITKEETARKKNFAVLAKMFKKSGKPCKMEFYSFYPLLLEQRDALRKHLLSKNIFLPVHWPGNNQTCNMLYDKIISIPLDSRYSESDMKRAAKAILDFYMKS